MSQNINNEYEWRRYEKTLLIIASTLGWFPVIWVLFLPDLMGLLNGIINLFPNIMEDWVRDFIFISYVIFCLMVYAIIFGVLAGHFPKYYLFPAWVLSCIALFLSIKQVLISIVDPFDPNVMNYTGGSADYHSFSMQNVFLAIFALIFLIILFRPALFYVSYILRKLKNSLAEK